MLLSAVKEEGTIDKDVDRYSGRIKKVSDADNDRGTLSSVGGRRGGSGGI